VPDEVLRQLADLARVPALVDLFAELLQPYYGIPPTPLHEVLHEAAKRAGWAPLLHLQRLSILSGSPPAAELFSANRTWRSVGYWSRTCSNNCGLASRQRLVQREPLSQLKKLPFDRVPPMSVRTIKADIFYMKKNGNFGI